MGIHTIAFACAWRTIACRRAGTGKGSRRRYMRSNGPITLFAFAFFAPSRPLRPHPKPKNYRTLRWRTASYRQIPAATETFRLST